jgi:hypothetical protein
MSHAIEAMIPYPKPEHLDPNVKPAFGRFPIVPEKMTVEDLRGREGELSLEREGFMLLHWPSRVKNFRDPDEVRSVYVPEIESMLKEITGASKVTTDGGGLVRLSRRSPESRQVGVGTGNFVHADYSMNAGPTWIKRALPEAEAEERLKNRYGIYNIWRAYSEPPQDVPLGLCDARTVTQSDVIHCDLTIGRPGAQGFTFENSAYLYSPRHRWCYFSNMTRDEVLIFRGLESTHDRTSAVPHTAFEDPTCPPDAPARESIDIRSIVYYD